MATNNKEIKFSFVVDERSAQSVKRVLRELISDAERLAKVLSGASIGGGAGGMGIQPSPYSGLLTGSVGGAQSGQRMLTNTQAKSPVTQTLTQVLVDNANNLKGLANISKDSMRLMSDGVKRAVDEQKRSLSELDVKLAEVAKSYDQLAERKQRAIAGGMTADEADQYIGMKADRLQKENAQLLAERNRKQGELADIQSLDPEAQGSAGGSIKALMGLLRKSKFGPLMNMAPTALMGTLAFGAMRSFGDEVLADPMRFQAASARNANLFGQRAVATQYGDLKTADVLARISQDPNFREEFQGLRGGDQRFLLRTKQLLGDLSFNPLHSSSQGFDPFGFRAATFGQTDANINAAVNERQAQYMQNVQSSDPRRAALLDQFAGQAQGRLGMMRALGIGASTRGGYTSEFDRYLQPLRARGFSDGESVGMHTSIEQVATRAAAHALTGAGLNAQAAGFSGASSMLGSMSMLGTGAARNFMSTLMGASGDVSSLNQIGSFISSMMLNGASPTNGLGMMGMLTSGLTGGTGDALVGQQNIMGAGALQNLVGGRIDPYQQGRNLLNAIRSAPDQGIYAQNFLANGMDVRSMTDVLASGKITPEMRARFGGTDKHILGEVRQTYNSILGSTIDRVIDQGGNSDESRLARILKASGGNSFTAFRQHYQHMSNHKAKDRALSAYATILQDAGVANSFDEAVGMARDAVGAGGHVRGGKHRGDVGAGSAEAHYVAELAEQVKNFTAIVEEKGKSMGSAMDVISRTFNNAAVDISKSSTVVSQELQAAADTMIQAQMHPKWTSKDALSFYNHRLAEIQKPHPSIKAAAAKAAPPGGYRPTPGAVR